MTGVNYTTSSVKNAETGKIFEKLHIDTINFANEVFKAVGYSVGSGLVQAVKGSDFLLNDLIDISIKTNQGRQKINGELAHLMQEAVVNAYNANVIALQRVPSYREGQGRFPLALGRALASEEFAKGTGSGISFINTDLLDSVARHWARLNYGAAPNAGGLDAPSFNVAFGDVSFPLHLGGDPRPGFSVPNSPGKFGYFKNGGEFHISSKFGMTPRPSKTGIGARRFLDAGLGALAKRFGPVYTAYLTGVVREIGTKEQNRTFRS